MADFPEPVNFSESKTTTPLTFDNYIIGIGASAGGLESIMEFFDNIPAETSCTFIIVQHLSPDYKSLMPELLGKHTRLTIFEAEDNMLVKPGCVYLIPHKKTMTIAYGRLKLADKIKEHLHTFTIDLFFNSLAAYKKEKAIAVVLSGTGSDGSKGLEMVKKEGGLIIVQDPVSAKFDGMPNSAIATGMADVVLAPEFMPEEIFNFIHEVQSESAPIHISEEEVKYVNEILEIVKRHTNLDFAHYKRPTILRRIVRKVRLQKIDSMLEYKNLLEQDPEEVAALSKEFLIGVTKFFRDPFAFDALGKKVFPEIFKDRSEANPVKIWVAACSTGEEAYTLAMLLTDYLEESNLQTDVKIFATDVDRDAINYASKGCYPETIINDIAPARLHKYFEKSGKDFKIIPTVKKMVIFARHDLIKDPAYSKMDLVCCRNLLIYFNSELQKNILSKFHFSLNSNGFLFLGPSESHRHLEGAMREIDKKWRIYKKTSLLPAADYYQKFTPGNSYGLDQKQSNPDPRRKPHNPLTESLNETLLSLTGYCALYVNENSDLLQAVGNFKDYLELPDKNFSLNIFKMMPEELSIATASLVRKVAKAQARVLLNGVRIRKGEEVRIIDLVGETIHQEKASAKKIILVLLRQRPEGEVTAIQEPHEVSEVSLEQIYNLETELNETRENLQSAIEELETANEEMQSTNEELVSANEELQSTNEELQSLNEELHTVNTEFQQKITELIDLNDDLNNYFRSTDIGQAFIDKNLIIRKFTPAIVHQINLIPSDLGRPISHISHNIKYKELIEDIEKINRNGGLLEREVQAADNRWYLMKIMPYVKLDKSTDGVVLTFVDISGLKEVNGQLTAVLNSSLNGIMGFKAVRDAKNTITDFELVLTNETSDKTLRKATSKLIGKSMRESLQPLFEKGLFEQYVQVVDTGASRHIEHLCDIESQNVWLEVIAVKMGDGITVTFANINDKKLAQQKVRDAYSDLKLTQENLKKLNNELETRVVERTKELSISEERFRLLSVATNDAVYDWDFATNKVWWSEGFKTLFGHEVESQSLGVDYWFSHIHPADREVATSGIQKAISSGEKLWSAEYRLARADGSYANVLDRGYVLQYEDNMPYRMIGSIIDLTNLKKAQTELEHTNENLMKINADLDSFIYTASHDLKAPISNIEGLVITLKDVLRPEDQEGNFIIDMINLSINRFKETIHDLTEIAKSQREDVEDFEEVNVIDMVEEVKFSIQDMFIASKGMIHYDIQVPLIRFSKKNFRSIIYNLLSNAIKYSAPDRLPVIHISTNILEQGGLLLTVSDNGLGIEKSKQGKIFTMFKRFHDHVEGTGIGLYIVKRIVTNSGGKIEVESDPGMGTTFRIYFKQ